jgi:hypothetical protein
VTASDGAPQTGTPRFLISAAGHNHVMSILSKLRGTAQGNAARSQRAGGRSTTGKGWGGGTGGRATGRGKANNSFTGFTSRGRASSGRGRAAPASSGGLRKLIGSLTGRR